MEQITNFTVKQKPKPEIQPKFKKNVPKNESPNLNQKGQVIESKNRVENKQKKTEEEKKQDIGLWNILFLILIILVAFYVKKMVFN